MKIHIQGHADKCGKVKYNMAISKLRTDATRKFKEDKLIPAENLMLFFMVRKDL